MLTTIIVFKLHIGLRLDFHIVHTETTVEYSSGGGGGVGAGIAQLDIIAELPVTSVSASNTTGAVGVIGVGANNSANSANGVGVTPPVSFDNTSFTITTRPI